MMRLTTHLYRLWRMRLVRTVVYFLLFTLAGLYTMRLDGALLFGLVMVFALNAWRTRRDRRAAEQAERAIAEHSDRGSFRS